MEGGTGGDSWNRQMPEYLPERLEAGTHNAPGAAGLTAGMRFVNSKNAESANKTSVSLTRRAALSLAEINGVTVYFGSPAHIGPISFTINGIDSETAASHLSERNIAVRGGLHCAPLAHETAGTSPFGTVRATFSHTNTAADVAALVRAVREIAV
jgi:selenocysteine lyase/cysteine desulfurase